MGCTVAGRVQGGGKGRHVGGIRLSSHGAEAALPETVSRYASTQLLWASPLLSLARRWTPSC